MLERLIEATYSNPKDISLEKHLLHIEHIVDFYGIDAIKALKALKNSHFVLCSNGSFQKACDVCVDEPFEKNGLKFLSRLDPNTLFMSEWYLWLDSKICDKFIAIIKKLGAVSSGGLININIVAFILSCSREPRRAVKSVSPSVVIDKKRYVATEIKRLKTSMDDKLSQRDTNNFLQAQYKDHCQICGTTFMSSADEECCKVFNWLSGIPHLRGGSLLLCPNCLIMLKKSSFTPLFLGHSYSMGSLEEFMQITVQNIPGDDIPNCFVGIESDMYKIPILLNNKQRYIFYSEEHFLSFYTVCLMSSTLFG